MSRISLLTLILSFGLNASAVMPVDPSLNRKCDPKKLGQLVVAIDALQNDITTDGDEPAEHLRKVMLATAEECGPLRINPKHYSDNRDFKRDILRLKNSNSSEKVMKASFSGLRKFAQACSVVIGLISPDAQLTGPELIPECNKTEITDQKRRDSGSGHGTSK